MIHVKFCKAFSRGHSALGAGKCLMTKGWDQNYKNFFTVSVS